MSSLHAFLVGVSLLLFMPCVIHGTVDFDMYKRFVESNCLSLGRIAQDICPNTEAACLPVFELVEYCERFCGAHVMDKSLLYSAIMPGNIPRLNETMCRYCARDPMGLTCDILKFLVGAAECISTTTSSTTTPPPTTAPSCTASGIACVGSASCIVPIPGLQCPTGMTCCVAPATTTLPPCTVTGIGCVNTGTCVVELAAFQCPASMVCCVGDGVPFIPTPIYDTCSEVVRYTFTMALVGKIDEFDSSKEHFEAYAEHVSQFFIDNVSTTKKRVAIFVSLVGAATYGVLKNLLTSEKPADKTFDEIIQNLTKSLGSTINDGTIIKF